MKAFDPRDTRDDRAYHTHSRPSPAWLSDIPIIQVRFSYIHHALFYLSTCHHVQAFSQAHALGYPEPKGPPRYCL